MNDGTEDSYLEGDRLLCREIKRELWIDSKLHIRKWDFVIVHKEGVLIKRIVEHNVENGTITVHSLNPIYPDKIINLSENQAPDALLNKRSAHGLRKASPDGTPSQGSSCSPGRSL